MEDWQDMILDEIGTAVYALSIGACGMWIPLFTDSADIAVARHQWLIELAPVIDGWEKSRGKKCKVGVITEMNKHFGAKVIFE